jgi:purine catabolism regulator
VVEDGQHVSIQPVSAQGRVEAFLALGKREALTQFDRVVSSHALSLLALELAKTRAVSETERRLKGDLLDRLLREAFTPHETGFSLERLGFDLDRPVQVVVLSGDEGPESLQSTSEEALAALPHPFLCSARDDLVVVATQTDAADAVAALRTAVAARTRSRVIAGAGNAVPIRELAVGFRQAQHALQVCKTEGREVAEFRDLGTYQLLLSLQDPEALRTFADSVLAPLDQYDDAHGGDLVPSLRAFLDRNARWESAAKDLYVHRHTLRYRMRKVEELTRRDLASARDRMEFFLALRARDMLSDDGGPVDAIGRTRGARRPGRDRSPLSPSYKPSPAVARSASSPTPGKG